MKYASSFVFESICLLGLCSALVACGDDPADDPTGAAGSPLTGGGMGGMAGAAGSETMGGAPGAGTGGTPPATAGMTGAVAGSPVAGSTAGVAGGTAGGPMGGGTAGVAGGTAGVAGGTAGVAGGTAGVAGGTAGVGGGEMEMEPEAPVVEAMTFTELRAWMGTSIQNQSTCYDCHAEGGDLPQVVKDDETLYETLMTREMVLCDNMLLVVPGDPDNSALYRKLVDGCGDLDRRMPKGCVVTEFEYTCAPEADIEAIRLWILDGAPEN